MPNHISSKKFEKTVLDIWENEGGRISTDARRIERNDAPAPAKISPSVSDSDSFPRASSSCDRII